MTTKNTWKICVYTVLTNTFNHGWRHSSSCPHPAAVKEPTNNCLVDMVLEVVDALASTSKVAVETNETSTGEGASKSSRGEGKELIQQNDDAT